MTLGASGPALLIDASGTEGCSAPFRVRFDEAGPDGQVRTSVWLRYAQDVAWYHSAVRGFTRDWYRARGLTWLARAASVTVLRPAQVGDALIGTTKVVGWRRVWARRQTDFVDGDGALVAWTTVDWVLLDARWAPARIPGEIEEAFHAPHIATPLARVGLDAVPPDARQGRHTVRPQELDPMDHVNNAVYADWVDEHVLAAGGAADVGAIPRTMRLDYVRAAERDATVESRTWRDGDGAWSCRVTDGEGTELLRARLVPASGNDTAPV